LLFKKDRGISSGERRGLSTSGGKKGEKFVSCQGKTKREWGKRGG